MLTCRVPNWRVLTREPEDLYKSPLIPDKAIWKIIKTIYPCLKNSLTVQWQVNIALLNI